MHLSSVFLELPVSVVKWAYLSGPEPSRDAVEVERMLGRVSKPGSSPAVSTLTLQIPQATVHSSVVDEPWLA